ncbi:MAG: fasciclin domain-containing protein [Actinobacteria bacterium]|nr:fasciclin domain-containing protein [Actinomycetota bacterium]
MKRSVRLLSLLAAILLLLAACSTAEEAEPAPEGGGEDVITEPALEEPTEPAADTDADTDADADASAQSILEVAQDNPQLSQLVQAIEAAGLTDALEQAGPLTVFAPNDEAFAKLDQSDLTALLTDPASLGDRLQYHVVEGSLPSSELTDGEALTTAEGSELMVSVDGSTIMVGDAEVVQADIQAGNGVIHVIDTVLEP